MKDKKSLWIALGIFLIGILALRGTKSKEEIIKDYMKDKYKEEFVIELMGKRDGEIIAEVIPKKYIGTIRQYDSYYSSSVFLPPNEDIGDNYGGVLLKESANEYFRPKLEELFGKNILPVLTLEGGYDFPDFKKEMEKRQKKFIKYPNGRFSPLSGGIYIFGRVESESDREYYRKQIYEFIQYLKAENMFDYVSLRMAIVDERVISKEYLNNKKLKDDLSKLFLEGTKDNIRKNVIDTIGENYTINEKYISQINKGIFSGMHGLNKYPEIKGGILLSESIYTPKYIKSNALLQGKVKAKEYNNLDEVFE